MTTYEVLRVLGRLSAELESAESIAVIHRARLNYSKLMNPVGAMSDHDANKTASLVGQLQSELNAIRQNLKESKPAQNFIALDKWITTLKDLNQVVEGSDFGLKDLIEKAQKFYDAYDQFVQNYGNSDTFYLMLAAHDLDQLITATYALSARVVSLLATTALPKDNYEELSIFFPSPTSLEDVIEKLKALKRVYEELCRLLDVSESEYPLQISKIEAGSLWIKLFGESKVIQTLTDLLRSGVSYMYRNFTAEGKVSAIPKNAEAIDSLLELSTKLRAHGIDNSVLNENIKQSAIIISQQLNGLLAGEPITEINGQRFSVGQEWDERFLRESRGLFIGAGEESQLEHSKGEVDSNVVQDED
jgi:hypothetical protein